MGLPNRRLGEGWVRGLSFADLLARLWREFGDFHQPAQVSLPIRFDGRGRSSARSSELDPNEFENRSGRVAYDRGGGKPWLDSDALGARPA